MNRRHFLKASAASCAATQLTPSATASHQTGRHRDRNDEPVIGYIGTGIRFHTSLGPGGTGQGPCAGVADVDLVQAGRALQKVIDRHREFKRPISVKAHEDYRHLLDDQSVDLIFVASPDHWHTKHVLDAMRAGKDVYCEKPLTLTIGEGQLIEKVMRDTNRIVQVGTQQRTEFGQRFARAAAIVRANRLGKLKRVTVAIGGARSCDPLPVRPVPAGLNWNLWQGQAAEQPYRSGEQVVDVNGWGAGHPFSRTHRYYRWFYEYSGGKLTDWGAHHIDIAMLAMDKLREDVGPIKIEVQQVVHPVPFDSQGMPTEHDRFNTANQFRVLVTFADGIEMMVQDSAQEKGFSNGIMFEGEAGRILVNRGKLVGRPVEALQSNPLDADFYQQLIGSPTPKSHIDNFVECARDRKRPISDVRTHNLMLNVCHAINVALRLNRNLTYNPKSLNFGDDELANSFIHRDQRKGFEFKA